MTYKILRTLSVFFLLPVLILGGCASQHERKSVQTDFSADFTASYNQMELEGHISANRQKLINIRIDAPQSLGGLEFGYNGAGLNIKRDDMVCSADEAYIPEGSFPNILKTIVEGVSDGRAVFEAEQDEGYLYNLKTIFGNVHICSNINGKIVSAELSEKKFYIEFKNVKTNE